MLRRRLIALLAVAAASGTTAVGLTNDTAGSPAAAAVKPRSVAAAPARCPIPARFRPAFERAAKDTRLPLALLAAMARIESRFQPDARSAAGARGLLQVMPETASDLRLDPNTPTTNVLAGARYLRQMLELFGTPKLALAAYNAGPSAVAYAGGIPGPETATYVRDVLATWRSLHGCV